MLQKCSQVCKVLYFYLANNISHVVIFRKDIIYLDKGYDWACVNVLKTAVTSVNDIHISIFVCQINVAMIGLPYYSISKSEFDSYSYF